MKKLKLLAFFALFLSALSFTSCDGDVEPLDPALAATIDDGSGDDGGSTTGIVGTYRLTAFNSSVPTDLNNDGSPSTNQMSESSCFNDNMLVLNANNTFTADSKGVELGLTPSQISCYVDPQITGTWVLAGNMLVLTYTDAGEQFVENYIVVGNTLKMTVQEGEVVGNDGDVYAYLAADLEIIYTKQ